MTIRHPRSVPVQNAELQITASINLIARKYDLTSVELLKILNGESALTLKYMLREERHPDNPDKPAELA